MAQLEPRPAPSNGISRVKVLLVEDEPEMRRLVELSLQLAGFDVLPLANGGELLAEFERNPPSPALNGTLVIVSDIRMPGPTGLEILDALAEHHSLPPVILVTAFGGPAIYEEAMRMGAAAVLDKPFDVSVLVDLIHEVRRTRQPNPRPAVDSDSPIDER